MKLPGHDTKIIFISERKARQLQNHINRRILNV